MSGQSSFTVCFQCSYNMYNCELNISFRRLIIFFVDFKFCLNFFCVVIDNHDIGYLGMAVQLYVWAHLGHYHILTQNDHSQKLMEIYTPFYLYNI